MLLNLASLRTSETQAAHKQGLLCYLALTERFHDTGSHSARCMAACESPGVMLALCARHRLQLPSLQQPHLRTRNRSWGSTTGSGMNLTVTNSDVWNTAGMLCSTCIIMGGVPLLLSL